MSQVTYNRYMNLAVPGLIADAEFTNKDGLQASESIGLGLAVIQKIGAPNQGRLPKANKSTIVFYADLKLTGRNDVINLKVNGLAMAPVTFSTDNATTMGLIVTAIKAISGVSNAILDPSDTDDHTIIVYSNDGLDCIVTNITVVGSTSPATATATATTTDTIYGVSIMSQAIQQPYPALNAPILYVNGDAVYMRFSGDHSVITLSSTTGVGAGTGAYAHSYASIAALASALGITTNNLFNTIDGRDTLDGALATAKGAGLVVGDTFKLTSSSTAVYLPGGQSAGYFKDAGNFRNDDDSGTCVLVDGMEWRTVTTAAGALAQVDINMPQ